MWGGGSPGASGLGSKAHLPSGLVEAQPACALILLARSALQEIKQEQKELREEQKITKAALKQLVTADQLQERVRFGGGTLTVVLSGRVLLVVFLATFPAWSGLSRPHGTWVCWLHPSYLKIDSFSPFCS